MHLDAELVCVETREELAAGLLEWEESVPVFLGAVRWGVRHLKVTHVADLHHVRDEVMVGDHDAFGDLS